MQKPKKIILGESDAELLRQETHPKYTILDITTDDFDYVNEVVRVIFCQNEDLSGGPYFKFEYYKRYYDGLNNPYITYNLECPEVYKECHYTFTWEVKE